MHLSIPLIEAVWLALVAMSACALVATRPLARMFPRVFMALVGALVLWVGGVGIVAVFLPATLHPLTVLAALGVGGAAWRARIHYGRSRRLPPGSLSLKASVEALVDREFYLKQAARHGPIFKMAQFHQPVVCVVGLSRGHQLLHDHEDALGPSTQRFNREIPGGFLRYMDDQTHKVYGPLFRQALSAQVVAHSWPVMVDTAGQELARAAADARRSNTRAVPPNGYLDRIVTGAFLRVLFGLAPGTLAFEQTMRLYQPLAPLALSDRPTQAARAALDQLRRLLTTQHERWLRSGPNETPVCALSELGRIDASMPDATCVDNLIFIHKISSSNVVGLLRWILVMLGRHPDWIARLRAELEAPAPSGPPALIDRIIMETLRLSQAEYLYRRMTRDTVFEGFRLPKGWLVRICVWESHRSAANFNDPDRFNPDRFLALDYPRSAYSPFGADRHACNGVPLTNAICRAFLEQITRRYDWAVERHEALARDFRHWSHWRPGAGLRLRLDPIPNPAPPASATDPGREAVAAG